MPGARENTSQQDEIGLVKRPITREGSANFQEKGKLNAATSLKIVQSIIRNRGNLPRQSTEEDSAQKHSKRDSVVMHHTASDSVVHDLRKPKIKLVLHGAFNM